MSPKHELSGTARTDCRPSQTPLAPPPRRPCHETAVRPGSPRQLVFGVVYQTGWCLKWRSMGWSLGIQSQTMFWGLKTQRWDHLGEPSFGGKAWKSKDVGCIIQKEHPVFLSVRRRKMILYQVEDVLALGIQSYLLRYGDVFDNLM